MSIPKIVKTAINGAKQNFKNSGHVDPVLLMETHKGFLIFDVRELFVEGIDKSLRRDLLQQILSEYNANSYCLINEAWQSTKKNKDEVKKALDEYGSISNMPDKKTVIIILYQHILSKNSSVWTAEQLSPNKLSEFEKLTSVSGNLSNLFDFMRIL